VSVRRRLIDEQVASEAELTAIETEALAEVDDAQQFAVDSAAPWQPRSLSPWERDRVRDCKAAQFS
ncbi:MAG: hypothetical protein AAF495_24735, partial [Pseudomonadota bacterium]